MTIAKYSPKPPDEPYFPKAGYARRAMALGIDFLGAWLVSSPFGNSDPGIQVVQILVFVLAWLILRVVVVYNNKGQSLGRFCFDLKVLELGKPIIPELLSLFKREAIIGLGALLVSIALGNIIRNPTAILLVIPLAIDCGTAFSDTQWQQALHDRYASTMVVSSRRGYSLDLKLKRLVEKARRNVRL
ncbi:RDD domain-containing protein [Calothrix sp. NIES-4071]|nr:RDD domain-containing protein [Calothrix sp. NIES-4071]BAZ56588.1 RDD domain-containing protein [Calothrix sp. NIES-4105]